MDHIVVFSIAFRPYIGGAEVAVEEISKRLQNYKWSIVTLRFKKSDKKYEEWHEGRIKIYRIGLLWLPLFLRKVYYVGLAPFFALIKLPKSKIVWSMMANYAGFAGLFYSLIKPKTRFVLTLQEGDSVDHIKNRARKVLPIFKAIFGRADVIQTISNFLADFAKSINPALSPVVIPNGVDIDLFKPNQNWQEGRSELRAKIGIPPQAFVLVTTSRLVHKNGIDRVIDAMTVLADAHFLIVGDGHLRGDLEILAKDLSVSDRVHFVGSVMPEEVPQYLHASDVFIRLSRTEGLGNSFVEAMASHIPVIATSVGGIPDIVEDGRNGLLVVGDKESVKLAVEKLRHDPNFYEKVRKEAVLDVEQRFDFEAIAERMEREVFRGDDE